MMRRHLLVKAGASFLFLTGVGFAKSCVTLPDWANKALPPETTQLMMVFQTAKGPILNLCDKINNQWQLIYTPRLPIQLGKSGIAPLHHKQEGDHKTPAGLYAIGPAFGSIPKAVKMDYRYITEKDEYIDDVHSPRYNTWVMSNPHHEHHEKMLRPAYQLGAVVQYNQDPIVSGLGSAIFIHLSSIPAKGTEGCIAMDKSDLIYVLDWLDKSKRPYVFIEDRKA